MAITYHAGRRLQGTSTDATAVSGGWKEVGRTTLGSAGATIEVSSLDDKRYYMILGSALLGNAGNNYNHNLGNGTVDTGSNYASRRSLNGASDTTSTSATAMSNNETNGGDKFHVGYITNLSDKEKLIIDSGMNNNTNGSANAPDRAEMVGKWTNTSNPLDLYRVNVGTSAGIGSEVVVLGWDPDDTHTDNFWEQLASVNGDGTGGFSSGTFAAKKYLWVQTWVDPSASSRNLIRFNDDSGSNYSVRHSINGSESTLTSQTSIDSNHTVPLPKFFNMFIVNNSANEKLLIEQAAYVANAGSSGTPQRTEIAGKWANTSDQITKIDYIPHTGNYSTDSKMIVWGSD